MNNVFLAPATKDIKHMTDQVVFQSAADIQAKVAGRHDAQLLRAAAQAGSTRTLDNPDAYRRSVFGKLTGHFPVVQDEFQPRIAGLFGPKPTSSKVLAQIRQAVCKAKTPVKAPVKTPAKKMTP